MKLFTVGPVQPYPEIREVYGSDIPYFRTETYGDMVRRNIQRLADHLNLPEGGAVLYFAASGTGAMEATVDNCLTVRDKALVINGGTFGHRFCQLLKHYNIPHTPVNLNPDEALLPEHLAAFDGQDYTVLLVNLHETSTGQLYDIHLLSDFCRRNNMLLIVDAISTFMADPYDMGSNGVDVTIFSSQKGLCLSPGVSFVALSRRMLDRLNTQTSSLYFNFAASLVQMERGQTPFTPAVNIMYELQAMLDRIDAMGGLAVWLEQIRRKCTYFRTEAPKYGIRIGSAYPLSNMMTPVFPTGVDAYRVFLRLAEVHDIYVNPCGGELAGRMLRVAHVGNTTEADIDQLLACMADTIETLKSENK